MASYNLNSYSPQNMQGVNVYLLTVCEQSTLGRELLSTG